MEQKELDRMATAQMLPLVLNGDEQALWGCVRLAQRYNDIDLLVRTMNNWRGYLLDMELRDSVPPLSREEKGVASSRFKRWYERYRNMSEDDASLIDAIVPPPRGSCGMRFHAEDCDCEGARATRADQSEGE